MYSNDKLLDTFAQFYHPSEDPVQCLSTITDLMLDKGSTDNQSIILCELGGGNGYGTSDSFGIRCLPGPLYFAMNDPNYLKYYYNNCYQFGMVNNLKIKLLAFQMDLQKLDKQSFKTGKIYKIYGESLSDNVKKYNSAEEEILQNTFLLLIYYILQFSS